MNEKNECVYNDILQIENIWTSIKKYNKTYNKTNQLTHTNDLVNTCINDK